MGRGRESEMLVFRKPPEKDRAIGRGPQPVAMEVLRRCALDSAQRLVHCAIALSSVLLDRVSKTISVALAVDELLGLLEATDVPLLCQPSSKSLLMIYIGQN